MVIRYSGPTFKAYRNWAASRIRTCIPVLFYAIKRAMRHLRPYLLTCTIAVITLINRRAFLLYSLWYRLYQATEQSWVILKRVYQTLCAWIKRYFLSYSAGVPFVIRCLNSLCILSNRLIICGVWGIEPLNLSPRLSGYHTGHFQSIIKYQKELPVGLY